MRPLRSICSSLLAILAFGVFSRPSLAAAPDPPSFLLKWGSSGSAAGQFNNPNAVAVDEQGNVYVLDAGNYRVQKFNRLGTFLTQWGSFGSANGQLYNPVGIAVDLSGNVFVADGGNGRIQKFTSSGTYVAQWGAFGSGPGQFTGMGKLAVDAAGNVYVPDAHRVQKFTNGGAFVTQWGSQGSGNGQFEGPNAVAVDPAGNVYVVDRLNARIQKFTSSGVYLTQWNHAANMSDVAVDALGDVYVVDDDSHVTRYGSSGTFEIQWGSAGSADGQFDAPKALEVDAEGNVYVCDTLNRRMQKLSGWGATLVDAPPGLIREQRNFTVFGGAFGVAVDPAGNCYVADVYNNRVVEVDRLGNFIRQWGSAGTANSQFVDLMSIARGPNGLLYVVDQGNARVQRFTPLGQWAGSWGASGTGNGQFTSPQGIAIDAAGDVYVTDQYACRVQKFTADGTYVTQWGSQGSGPGQFMQPMGIAVDAAGNVFVADQWTKLIQKFTPTGVYLSSWVGNFDHLYNPAFDTEGTLYTTEIFPPRIQRFTPDGTPLSILTLPLVYEPNDQYPARPKGITVDATGTIVVTEIDGGLAKFTMPPRIAFVSDVRNDQGRSVRLRILRASADSPISGATITGYAVYRRQDPPAASAGAARLGRTTSMAAATAAGWDYVTTIPARGDPEYGVLVPTMVDANAGSRAYSAFFVSALTPDPYVYFDSPVESGYSIDNISPGTPTPFLAVYSSGATSLHWAPSAAADFATFRLYRGASSDFTPGQGNLIASMPDTGYVDAGAAGGYYKLAAVDWNGNESPYALVGPSQTVDVEPPGSLAFAVEDLKPNPVRGHSLEVRFTLPATASADVELIDVGGRRIAQRRVSGAGPHVVALGRERVLSPGLYLVRVACAGEVQVKRAVVVR